MSIARVFTGYKYANGRPNIERDTWKGGTGNWVDPVEMNAVWHDSMPKGDLLGGYLGDGYPLCDGKSSMPCVWLMYKKGSAVPLYFDVDGRIGKGSASTAMYG